MAAAGSNPPPPVVTWKELLGGTSTVVAVAYALAYSAHLGFWGAFGLSPGEVGISGTELLGRLTVGAAWILLIGGAFALTVGPLMYWAVRWLLRKTWPTKPRRKIDRAALSIGLAVTLVAGYLALWLGSGVDFGWASRIAMMIGLAWVLALPSLMKRVTFTTSTTSPVSATATPVFPLWVRHGVVTLGIVGLLAVMTNLWMFGIGDKLSTGIHSQATFVVGVTPPYATVTWPDSTKVPDSYRRWGMTASVACASTQPCTIPRPLLYLGTANDYVVVWDCRAHATYLVAKGDARIELARGRIVGLTPQEMSTALQCTKDGALPPPMPTATTSPSAQPSSPISGQPSGSPSPQPRAYLADLDAVRSGLARSQIAIEATVTVAS